MGSRGTPGYRETPAWRRSRVLVTGAEVTATNATYCPCCSAVVYSPVAARHTCAPMEHNITTQRRGAKNMTVTDPRDRLGFDRRLEWLGAWSGIAWVVICGGGFGGSGLLPVWAASTKPEVLAAHLADIKYQLLIGMLLVLIGGLTLL